MNSIAALLDMVCTDAAESRPRERPVWRHFSFKDAEAALAWAAAGGVAVHDTGVKLRGRRTAHLFARDEASLLEAARSVGCDRRWIQRRESTPGSRFAAHFTTHFDLFGVRLVRALERCQRREVEHD